MPTFIKVHAASATQPHVTPMRCPSCRREGSFHPINGHNDVIASGALLGHRVCPNPSCLTHVFVMFLGGTTTSFPPETIDFDAAAVPAHIVNVFEEALTCHANCCYRAAAMLVRKTLEILCEERGAAGKDLKDRLGALRKIVILPEALFQAADGLRLLGNDAAHIEAKTYLDVGKEETAVAIVLAKEILKAVYQYDALVSQLTALKK